MRGAALRALGRADCLASDIDFAITCATKLLRVRDELESAGSLKMPEEPCPTFAFLLPILNFQKGRW
jgi:hypothetical protein